MSRQTRRTFLAAVGAAGLAGCAGITDSGGTPSSTTDGTTTGSPGDGTSNGDGTTPSGQGGARQLEDFEKLQKWHPVEGMGSLNASKDSYTGSQAARVKGGSTNEGKIFSAQFGSDGLDLSGQNLSFAYKCTSHDFSKISVELHAPDSGHVVELKRTVLGPKDTWMRINLGTTDVMRPKSVDLSKVYQIRIVGRPRDHTSNEPVEFLVDDLQAVPTPKKGKVMLTFDDGLASHYTKAYEKMKQYGFPGVDAVITEAVYDDGFLTTGQMREMTNDGWEMMAHPNVGSTPMPELSRKKQKSLMTSSKQWLKRHGFDGHSYLAVPKNAVGKDTFALAQKHFDLTFTFGGGPSALPVTTKDAILPRIYADDVRKVKRMVDFAAEYKQLTVPLFHRIGGKNGLPEKDFETILKYVKKKDVDVVTPSDLKEQGLLR
ncbi:polysaccharide deacetylase family protein [Halomicrococcus gelatinilyticus]|uniref:polysaccharide deacetylase family protein n=1 Tax=Halomicrococcus gelatinilyticus TaxID=1702103 RepID=UPI002E13EFDC